MEKLFSYGTLQIENVQIETFGRKLKGVRDVLPGYLLAEIEIRDPEVIRKSGKVTHPILRHSGNPDHRVEGTLFEVSMDELLQADSYEVDAYERKRETFASGVQAWVYVESLPV